MANPSVSTDTNAALKLVERLAEKKANEASKARLWHDITEEFGGQQQFVKEMVRLYRDCKDGSGSKVRMGALFLTIFAQASNATLPSDDELQLSTDELASTLAQIAKHGIGSIQLDAP